MQNLLIYSSLPHTLVKMKLLSAYQETIFCYSAHSDYRHSFHNFVTIIIDNNYTCITCTFIQFVAHPNSQQLLTSIWYEGLPSWRKRNFLIKFIMCIGLILLLPFMAMYYWVFPHSRIGQLLRSPFMKFLYHSASYGVFLILLMCSSIELSGIKGREKTRGPPPTELEWFVCIWVMGR